MRMRLRSPLLQRVRRHRGLSLLFRPAAAEDALPPRGPRQAWRETGSGTRPAEGTAREARPRPEPAAQRVPPPQQVSATAEESALDERTWGRLQAIYRKHQERAQEETVPPPAEEAPPPPQERPAEKAPPPQEPPSPPRPALEQVWPVQRKPAAPPVPPPPETTPPALASLPPGKPSASGIEFVPPRRPRPPRQPALPPRPAQPGAQPAIPTEIGPLPADLWELIGEEPAPPTVVQRAAAVEEPRPPVVPSQTAEAPTPSRPAADLSVPPEPKNAPSPAAPSQTAEAPTPSRPGGPDLETLAWRVYEIIRRQLHLEKERMG